MWCVGTVFWWCTSAVSPPSLQASTEASPASAEAAPAQQAPAAPTDPAAYDAFVEEQAYYHALAYAEQQAAMFSEAKANADAWQHYMASKGGAPAPGEAEAPHAQAGDADAQSFVETNAQVKAQAQAQWGFGRGFQPQMYGYWQQKQGNWNFGADKRIECEGEARSVNAWVCLWVWAGRSPIRVYSLHVRYVHADRPSG